MSKSLKGQFSDQIYAHFGVRRKVHYKVLNQVTREVMDKVIDKLFFAIAIRRVRDQICYELGSEHE